MTILLSTRVDLRTHTGPHLRVHYSRLAAYIRARSGLALGRHPAWLSILHHGFGHIPYLIEAVESRWREPENGPDARFPATRGVLPLSLVSSWLFGRYLVSLPYLNTGGVVADDDTIGRQLISEAVRLADQLEVKYLELRHERLLEHSAFTDHVNGKVHMRLALPPTAGMLWDSFPPKVRNQVRKAQKNHLTAAWGGADLLSEFYDVFSQNMRDLGTPVYGRRLFQAIVQEFPDVAEFCIVRAGDKAIAAGLLLHGAGIAEVPSASSLRAFNSSNANMLLYWNLLQRSVERGQCTFDFGRSSPDSGNCRFKKQWGAKPTPGEWQYYRRNGHVSDARPDNPCYQRFIRWWQKLPVAVANLFGPWIVRGIP